jgi:site-specific DNA recombinase
MLWFGKKSTDCLRRKTRLEQEYRRRLLPQEQSHERNGLEIQMSKLRRGIARLIDSYADGLIDKQEFEPRVTCMRERIQHLETQIQSLKEEAEMEGELRLILGQLETFAAKVKTGLQHADFFTRREIIRTLVKRVEVDEKDIRVIFRVSPTWSPSSSEDASPNWQHCGRRVHPRRLHRDHLTLVGFEPVAQRRTKCADLFLYPCAVQISKQATISFL